jgi:hypothetical protein
VLLAAGNSIRPWPFNGVLSVAVSRCCESGDINAGTVAPT